MFAKRKERSRRYKEASELYITSAQQLLDFEQGNESMSMLSSQVEMLGKIASEETRNQVYQNYRDRMIHLLTHYRYCSDKVKLMELFKAKFGEEDITKNIGQEALKAKDFPVAQRYLLSSTHLPNQIMMLQQWMSKGKQDEKDLFVARYVLLKLCTQQVQQAQFIAKHFSKMQTPLIAFISKLFQHQYS